MAQYDKPWLSIDEQLEQLKTRHVDIGDRSQASALLSSVGYYRVLGYLYPFREPLRRDDGSDCNPQARSDMYFHGTTLQQARELITFDRRLRMRVFEGVELIEVALRMRVAYVLGRRSPFAHEDPSNFSDGFARPPDGALSKHAAWLDLARTRQDQSDEQFAHHFRDKYEARMPIWVLADILELGQLARLYRGLNDADADEIAALFGVPRKKLMTSWLASLNYVRNVAAHHARLFNRKLQNAPGRPKRNEIPLLCDPQVFTSAKGGFGVYNALAAIAYLLRSVDGADSWVPNMVALFKTFPPLERMDLGALGAPKNWDTFALWQP